MESRAFSYCTRNTHRPSTPGKRGQTKRKRRKKVTDRDRFESLRMLRYRSWRSSIPLSNVLRQRR